MKPENSKRGSYILEASLVLPVIIFAVITLVLIIMFFYSQVTGQCRLHMAVRSEAGAYTGKTMYISEDKDDFSDAGEIYAEKKPAGCEVYGKKYLIMKHKGLLEKKGTFIVEGYCTGTDGPGYVRYHRLIEGANDE